MPEFVTIAGVRVLPPSPAAGHLAWAANTIELVAAVLVLGALIALLVALIAATRQPGGISSLLRGSTGVRQPDDGAAEAAAELRALIAEAREMADQLAATFDARAAELERRMIELESREARTRQSYPDEPAAGPFHAEPKLTSTGRPPAAHGRGTPAIPPHDTDPMTGEIYRLSDQGLPPVEIARHLGQHTGKVELILALRRV